MMQSTLIETFSLLRPEEVERFDKFLQSPFFNDGSYARDVLALWHYLQSSPAEALSVEQAYVVVFPKKPFVKGKVEVLMSKLHQLLKQFAAQITAPVFETPEAVRLAAFFMERGVPQRAVAVLEKLREAQAKKTVHDEAYWMERFLTEYQAHRLDTVRQNNHPHERLTEAIHCLHHSYLVQMLELLNVLFTARRKLKMDVSFAQKMAGTMPLALAMADTDTEPLLQLLGKGLDFLRAPDKNDITALEAFHQDLERYADVLPPNLLKMLFSYARNHCTWHHNNYGDTRYAKLSAALFKSCLERGLLHDNEKIQASTLLNMVQTGLVAGEFEWVKKALEQCKAQITGVPSPREFYYLNLANYHYYLKEYEQALDFLLESSDDLFNTLMARKLEIKIYYETDSVLLDSKIDNFKLFIFRQGKKNLAEDIFMMNNAFIDILRSMIASKVSTNPDKAFNLLEKVKTMPLIAERLWLQMQLERLAQNAHQLRRR